MHNYRFGMNIQRRWNDVVRPLCLIKTIFTLKNTGKKEKIEQIS